MQRDSFIFYRSFFEASKPLDVEQKAALFDTICSYALDHKERRNDSPIVAAMFSLIKPQLEANYKRFLNGKKGASIKQEQSKAKAKPKQEVSKSKANVNDNVNVNVNEKKRGSFTAPTLLEVEKIFISKGSTKLEAEQFYNFYGSKGWLIGKNKMKSVPLAVAGWLTRNKKRQNEKQGTTKEQRAEQLQQSSARKFGAIL